MNNKKIRIIFMIISLCAFAFFSYKIVTYLIEEKKSISINEELIEMAVTFNIQDEFEENQTPISVDFETLKKQNKDIVAWIFAEDTSINYPVVQYSDNDYYLRKLIDGSYNQAGTLFIDYRNNSDLSDFNTIIYGHNMKNGSMFGVLENYKNQSFYEDHSKMYIFTENKNYIVELFAGLTINNNSKIYDLSNEKDLKVIQELKEKSTFKSDVEITKNDKIITLSTCAYNYEGARYIIIGVLKEV